MCAAATKIFQLEFTRPAFSAVEITNFQTHVRRCTAMWNKFGSNFNILLHDDDQTDEGVLVDDVIDDVTVTDDVIFQHAAD